MYLLCDAIPWIEHRRDDLLGHDDAAAHAARKNKILIWELWNDKEYFRWIFLVVLRVRSGGDESSLVAGVLALKNANFIRQNGSTSRTFFQDCAVSHSESMWQMKGGGGGLVRCEGRFSRETPRIFSALPPRARHTKEAPKTWKDRTIRILILPLKSTDPH